MTYYEVQFWLGICAAILWMVVGYRVAQGHPLAERGVTAASVAFASMLVILIFGSLRLLRIIDDGTWFVFGTGLRGVVAVAGVVALFDMKKERDG